MTYLKVSENPKTMEVPRTVPRVKSVHHLTVIEWEMLDKKKFFPLSMMSSFTVRCFLYPLTLIRTRLQVKTLKHERVRHIGTFDFSFIQVQHKNAMYSGTFDAYKKISQTEGIRGLYRGFWISCFQVNKDTKDFSLQTLSMFLGGVRNILRVHIRGSQTYSRQEWSAGPQGEGNAGRKLRQHG